MAQVASSQVPTRISGVLARLVRCSSNFPPIPFLWANGVVFDRTPVPSTDEVIKKQLDGIIHWSSLEFAFIPTYESTIKVDGSVLPIKNVVAILVWLLGSLMPTDNALRHLFSPPNDNATDKEVFLPIQ